MQPDRSHPLLKIRIVFGDDEMMGPGKAELLERIAATGSISAAGRAMGMSYKRAWSLVETMNAMFATPVVTSTRGGAQGGGASLTEAGERVLGLYRAFEARASDAGGDLVEQLQAMLSDMSDRK